MDVEHHSMKAPGAPASIVVRVAVHLGAGADKRERTLHVRATSISAALAEAARLSDDPHPRVVFPIDAEEFFGSIGNSGTAGGARHRHPAKART